MEGQGGAQHQLLPLPKYQISGVFCERTCEWFDGPLVSSSPPGDGRKRNCRRAKPDENDENPSLGAGHFGGIAHGFFDGPVSIKTDHTEVQNGGCRGQHIKAVPSITPILTEDPLQKRN